MEELVSRGVCPCVSVGGCVWPTPPLWGRWGPGADSGGTDTVSCLAEPSSKEPVPPAQAASCKLCPLGWPPVPSLARAERRPSQGAPAPGSSPTAGQGLSVLGGDRPWAAAAPPGRGSGGTALISQHSPLRPGLSTPEGAQPQRPSRSPQSWFLLLFVCPRNLRKWAKSWGNGAPAGGPVPLTPITASWGWGERLSSSWRFSPCPTLPLRPRAGFPDFSLSHTLSCSLLHTPSSS